MHQSAIRRNIFNRQRILWKGCFKVALVFCISCLPYLINQEMSGGSRDTFEVHKDSPPSSPFHELTAGHGSALNSSDSSIEDSRGTTPPSSPMRRVHYREKRPSYSIQHGVSDAIPKKTRKLEAGTSALSRNSAHDNSTDGDDESYDDDNGVEDAGTNIGEAERIDSGEAGENVSFLQDDFLCNVDEEENHESNPQDATHHHSDSSDASNRDLHSDSQSDLSTDSDVVIGGESEDSSVHNFGDGEVQGGDDSDSDVHVVDSDSSSERSDPNDDPFDNEILYPGCEKTKDEAVYELLDIYLSHNLSKGALTNVLKFYVSSLPPSHNMPRSVPYFINYVESLSIPLDEIEHFYCRPALHSVGSKNASCSLCESTDIGVFYELPLKSRLQFLFEQRGLADMIDKYAEERARRGNDNCLHDVVDGSEYVRVWSDSDATVDKYRLTLILNTDGVSPYESSSSKMWPLMYSIAEIPPHLRNSFIIVWGVWFDKQYKPNMNMFLEPFVSDLVRINLEGGINWKHPKTGVDHVSHVRAPQIVADAPARAAILNMQEHQARYACNACEQKTSKLGVPPVVLGQRREKRKRRFLFQEEPATLRTHRSMLRYARYVTDNGLEAKRGMKGPTVLQDIPSIDLSTCVHAEYLHCVLTGVVKQICSLWFFKLGDWYIGDNLNEMNEFLLNQIHPPDFVSRLPRSLEFFAHFKANEFRSFLLYYSLVVVAPYLDDKFFQHWILLVKAIFLLLTESISQQDLMAAEAMLRLFVRDIGRLYGDGKYVYNVHQLTHLVLYVRRWGNLWANSAFCFENFNGILSRMIHGTKHEGRELMNRMNLAQGAQMLRNKIERNARSIANNIQLLGKPIPHVLNEKAADCLLKHNIDVADVQYFSRIMVGREQFSSKEYDKNFKRRNSFVKFKCDIRKEQGRIIVFLKVGHNILCMISLYKVVHTNLFFHRDSLTSIKHIVPVNDTGEIVLIEVRDIEEKMIQVGDYLCSKPNSFERKL